MSGEGTGKAGNDMVRRSMMALVWVTAEGQNSDHG
jgi:hypothetical protein